jgi:hypothetical protein
VLLSKCELISFSATPPSKIKVIAERGLPNKRAPMELRAALANAAILLERVGARPYCAARRRATD